MLATPSLLVIKRLTISHFFLFVGRAGEVPRKPPMTSVLTRINSRESKTLPLAAGDVCKISLLPNKQYVPYVAICSNASFGSGCARCALIHVLFPEQTLVRLMTV